MTDREDPETETDTMTDTGIPDALDAETDTDTYEKTVRRRLGQRGDPIFDEADEKTDLDDMTTTKDITMLSFCTCGESRTDAENVSVCCSCEDYTCDNCRVKISRYTYCPKCAVQEYGATKDVYLTLYRLDQDHLSIRDVIDTEITDGDVVGITIDDTITTLLEHGFLRTDDTTDSIHPSTGSEDPLTVRGKEALHVGEQLYSDDPDVQATIENFTIQQVADRDG